MVPERDPTEPSGDFDPPRQSGQRPSLRRRPVSGDAAVLADRYVLEEKLGSGGMADVWRAHDLWLERPVALKRIHSNLTDETAEDAITRFHREATLVAAVRHPNVIEVLDFSTDEEGHPFIVLELLVGESLERRLARTPPLTIDELVDVAVGLLDGLEAVHRAGIVHRDLKPDNVFLVPHEGGVRPKLLDFGVSRATKRESGRRSVLTTVDGRVVGTPEYMSPEQARGLADIDRRSDVYAVGAILYEALTGQLPYDAEGFGDLIIAIAKGGAPQVAELRPEVDESISDVIARAMSVVRDERYPTAAEMRDALLRAREGAEGEPFSTRGLTRRGSVARSGAQAREVRSHVETVSRHAMETPEPPAVPDATPPVPSAPPSPSEPKRRRPLLAMGAGATLVAMSAATIALWPDAPAETTPAMVAGAPERTPGEEEPPSTPASPSTPAAPGTVHAEPPPAPAPTVDLLFFGLPGDAEVTLDGEPLEVRDDQAAIPMDDDWHTVRVDSRRGRWRGRIIADENRTLRVRFGRRRSRSGSDDPPRIFRELD